MMTLHRAAVVFGQIALARALSRFMVPSAPNARLFRDLLLKRKERRKDMDGGQLISVIDEFGIVISAASRNQWKAKKDISPVIIRNIFSLFEKQRLYRAIDPITEFHSLHLDHDKAIDSFANRIGNKEIVAKLKQKDSIGIYAFFDASGRVIYIGKTENNLFTEMDQRYWQKPISFRIIKTGRAAPNKVTISNIAKFVSAYKITKHLITNVEALLTRIIINSASNIHVEAFNRLK